jgi:hypothetical protein
MSADLRALEREWAISRRSPDRDGRWEARLHNAALTRQRRWCGWKTAVLRAADAQRSAQMEAGASQETYVNALSEAMEPFGRA